MKKPICTAEDVRRELERRLRRPVADAIWTFFVKRGCVADVLDCLEQGDWEELDSSLSDLASMAKDLETLLISPAARPARPERIEVEAPTDERLQHLAQVLALDASREPDVVQFRTDVLGGQLLEEETSGDVGLFLLFQRLKDVCQARGIDMEEAQSCLRDIQTMLAQKYMWSQQDALRFVLAGTVPEIPRYAASVTLGDTYPSLTRINVSVHISVSPNELAKVYRDLRRKVARFDEMCGNAPAKRRNRPMSEKHLALAAFAHAHQGETGREKLEAWNAQHPEWKYNPNNIKNFQRDLLLARRRLLGKGDGDV